MAIPDKGRGMSAPLAHGPGRKHACRPEDKALPTLTSGNQTLIGRTCSFACRQCAEAVLIRRNRQVCWQRRRIEILGIWGKVS